MENAFQSLVNPERAPDTNSTLGKTLHLQVMTWGHSPDAQKGINSFFFSHATDTMTTDDTGHTSQEST